MRFAEVHETPLIRAAPVSAVDMVFMHEWARDHGKPMMQLSTMDKPGTWLISACQTPLSLIHLEHTALTPAVDVETDDDESEPEEAEDVELYEEDSEEENPDEPDPVSDSDKIQETTVSSLLTHSQSG